MNRYLTETIGTAVLVLVIGLTVVQGTPLAPIAIGFALMVMVYAGGPVSGAHYNPAVSVAATMRGALPARDLVPYIAAQLIGAVVASYLVVKFTGSPLHVAPAERTTALKALVGEALATAILANVVLQVATTKDTSGNSYFGLAIGGTVTALAFAFGGITGGAFNPAVGLGPAVIEMIDGGAVTPLVWVYAVGPVVGAVLGAVAFRIQRPNGS